MNRDLANLRKPSYILCSIWPYVTEEGWPLDLRSRPSNVLWTITAKKQKCAFEGLVDAAMCVINFFRLLNFFRGFFIS